MTALREDRRHGIAAAINEAGRIGKVITPSLRAALGAHVSAAFRDAQENVGVESGLLRSTGRAGTDLRDDGETWIGYNGWGGGSKGVTYAIYHLAQNDRWWQDYPAHEAAMAETIDAEIRRHLA